MTKSYMLCEARFGEKCMHRFVTEEQAAELLLAGSHYISSATMGNPVLLELKDKR